MALRRTGLLLGIAGILGMSLMGVTPASATAAPDPPASVRYFAGVKTDAATGVQPAAGCLIQSRSGNLGQFICGTQPVFVGVDPPGPAFVVEDIVIGVDYFIYSDVIGCPASGGPCNITPWSRLQNGIANSTLPVDRIGVGLILDESGILPPIINVVGTDNRLYCNVFLYDPSQSPTPRTWTGWRPC